MCVLILFITQYIKINRCSAYWWVGQVSAHQVDGESVVRVPCLVWVSFGFRGRCLDVVLCCFVPVAFLEEIWFGF